MWCATQVKTNVKKLFAKAYWPRLSTSSVEFGEFCIFLFSLKLASFSMSSMSLLFLHSPCLTKCYTLLPVTEDMDRQHAKQHIKSLDL